MNPDYQSTILGMILDLGHEKNSVNTHMLAFKCKRCGTCCYGKGGIFVRQDEIERIADFLGIDPASFVSRFCDEKNGRFSIKSGEDGYCVFYNKEIQCTIHPVNPTPCSTWPFYDALLKDSENWEAAKEACPGINPNCSFEDFIKQAKEGEFKLKRTIKGN